MPPGFKSAGKDLLVIISLCYFADVSSTYSRRFPQSNVFNHI